MTTVPTVSPTELIRSSWGNTVATELNTKTVKTDGSMPMTGPLVITATPGLRLRRTGDIPYLQFENTTGATTFATIQGSSTYLLYYVNNAAGSHSFRVGSATVATIDATGVTLLAGALLDAGAQVRSAQGRFGSTVGNQVAVIDTNGGGDAALAYVGYYPSATSMDAPGTRAAYVGYQGEGFQVQAAGNATVQAVAGDVAIAAGDDIFLRSGSGEFSVQGSVFLYGKPAANLDVAGAEMYGVGSSAIGSIRSTTTVASLQNIYLRHVGAADADTQSFVQFTRAAAGTVIGSITQNGTTGVHYNTTSDYRLKTETGPLDGAVDRLKLLRPVRYTWRDDPDGGPHDGFLAHEVAAAVPDAVTGDKDDVYPDPGDDPAAPPAGTIRPQQLDQAALVPLLTAALLEVVDRVQALEDQF